MPGVDRIASETVRGQLRGVLIEIGVVAVVTLAALIIATLLLRVV